MTWDGKNLYVTYSNGVIEAGPINALNGNESFIVASTVNIGQKYKSISCFF